MAAETADYFHGKLDRRTAEERLSTEDRVGSYLLRESDRKTGSFVLSYYGRAGINHFQITHAYGSFFIGGRQFNSLPELINYYTDTSDLLPNERLLYPVPPTEPVAAKDRLYISILPYTKLAQSDELSFKKGDMFILQNDLGDSWFWCQDVKTGKSGMVFSHLLEEVHEDIDPNEVFPWFHTRVSKADAVNKLAHAGPGSFLVRPSDNSPGNYTLFYHVGLTIQRFLIVKSADNRYTMGGKYFDSLSQIIELYQEEPITEGHVLQFPVTTTMSRADQLSEATLASSMRALKVRERPEDVYNTVKMSREAAKSKQSNDIRGWMSLKKGDIAKKWKSYFFVLNSRDCHLYYYEKPNQSKPKGLVDLSYSYIYQVHESLFDWPQCFQLVEKCLPCFANHFYLKCDGETSEFFGWLNSIKKYTTTNQSNKKNVDTLIKLSKDPGATHIRSDKTNGANFFEEERSVYLRFLEANSIKVSQPYFLVSFNQDVKVARTAVKTSPCASFTEDGTFVFEHLPADVKSITVSLHQSNKKSKSPLDLTKFSIDLSRLRSDEQTDHWFEFYSTHSPTIWAYLRARVQLRNDIVMGSTEYAGLEELICDPNTEIVSLLSQLCKRDHHSLARALSNVFRSRQKGIGIMKSLLQREVNLESDPSDLFRSSNLVTALVEAYVRSSSQTALIKCLREPVKKLLDNRISCELNPSKLDSHNVSQRACDNLQTLLDLLDELIGNIYDSVDYYSPRVRYLLSCLQRVVQKRWPEEPFIRTRVVGGFLFLRLICPTILNPRLFHLVNDSLSENAIRNLTLVARCLQNLVNLVDTPKVSLGPYQISLEKDSNITLN